MAYFRRNETEETLQQPVIRSAEERADRPQEEYVESDYDDGFDDPDELEEDELSKERNEIHKKRFLMLSGAGNLAAVIAGTLLILILLALLMNMIGFVINDADRNFTLFQTKF